jgi:hydroxymethylbilane synthase
MQAEQGIEAGFRLKLGTRGSKLAMAQAHSVKGQLESAVAYLEVEIVPIKTSGDRGERERLGAFVGEIQDSLLRGDVDIALHCLKDLPTAPVEGLGLAAYLPREDVRDTLISRGQTLPELAREAIVGTGSLRRTSQIAGRRSDLRFRPLVGNVDTRLRKLLEGEYDAIILAVAGLKRLGLIDAWATSSYSSLKVHPLEAEEMMPAPGQAVLVLETRKGDAISAKVAATLNDVPTAMAAECERAFLQRFGGGCSVPVGAWARICGSTLVLDGRVASPDGRLQFNGQVSGDPQEGISLGLELAEQLGRQGAFDVVNSVITARNLRGEAPGDAIA